MNDEKLIECVRRHVVLYDVSEPKYLDTNVKNHTWLEIGAEMGVEGSACKNRWFNIRDSYRKSLKRNATKSGKGIKSVKVYKYSKELEFLKKFLEKEPLSNIDSHGEADPHAEITENIQLSEHEEAEENVQEQNLPGIFQPPEIPSQSARKQTAVAKKSQHNQEFLDYLIRKNYVPKTQEHPVDAFLNAMAPALKNLSPYDWHLAKSEIFSTVQKYELKSMMHQPNFVTYDNPIPASPSIKSENSSESTSEMKFHEASFDMD